MFKLICHLSKTYRVLKFFLKKFKLKVKTGFNKHFLLFTANIIFLGGGCSQKLNLFGFSLRLSGCSVSFICLFVTYFTEVISFFYCIYKDVVEISSDIYMFQFNFFC